MSVSDSETDSDYRQFSPGRYAMRQLSRSVSRRTKKILAPAISRWSQRDPDQPANNSDGIFGENDDGKYRVAGGTNSMASNGYLTYEFGNTFGVKGSAAPYKRGPPEPSAIHRRSVSFDNLVLFPSMLQRRVTEPPTASTANPIEVGLPSASTWNSGSILTRAAAAAASNAANSAATSHLERSYSSMRRQWLAGLGHPLSTALDSEYHRKSLSSPQTNPELSRPLTIDTSLIESPVHDRDDQEAPRAAVVTLSPLDASSTTDGRLDHRDYSRSRNRESFSGPAHLDMSTAQSESTHSSICSADPFKNRNVRLSAGDIVMEAQEGIDSPTAMLPDFAIPSAAESRAKAAAAAEAAVAPQANGVLQYGVLPAAQMDASQYPSLNLPAADDPPAGAYLPIPVPRPGAQAYSPHILASAPISSGMFGKADTQRETQADEQPRREPTQSVRGNIARVFNNISKGFSRMRSKRSSSQPATPAEVRRSIIDSARRNMINLPSDSDHVFYRYRVNPEDPVSDREEDSRADSPTISYHSSSRRNRHRRNPTFPSKNFSDIQQSVDAEQRGLAEEPSDCNAVHRVQTVRSTRQEQTQHVYDEVKVDIVDSQPTSVDHLPPLEHSSPVFSNESLDRLYEDISGSSANAGASIGQAVDAPPAAPQKRGSSDSAYTESPPHEAKAREEAQLANGAISAAVAEKLAAGFLSSVRISSRLVSDLSAESSYGTFIRFHNSGELNGVFSVENQNHEWHEQQEQQPAQEYRFVEETDEEVEHRHHAYEQETRLHGYPAQQGLEYPPAPIVGYTDYRMQSLNIPGGTLDIDRGLIYNRHGYSTVAEFEGNLPPPSTYHRNQDQVKRFVDEMRVARQASTRRKLEAETQRQILNNHQAVLDAAMYIHERQQKEQQQEESKPRQAHGQQRSKGAQGAQGADESATAACAPSALSSALPSRSRRDRRRPSEDIGRGRRRPSVFGLFCAPTGTSPPSPPLPPLPNSALQSENKQPVMRRPQAPAARYVDKDLPPRPTSIHARAVDTRTRMQRSRSFSNVEESMAFGSKASQWTKEDLHVPWHNRGDHPLGGQASQQTERISYPLESNDDLPASYLASNGGSAKVQDILHIRSAINDPVDGMMESVHDLPGTAPNGQRRPRGSFFAEVLGRITGHHPRRLSANYFAGSRTSAVGAGAGAGAGGRQKLTRSRISRRHTSAAIEDYSPEFGAVDAGPRPTHSQPPNVDIDVPKVSLSEDICADIVEHSLDQTQSSTQKRMYADFLTSLRGSGTKPAQPGNGLANRQHGDQPETVPRASASGSQSSRSPKFYPSLGISPGAPRDTAAGGQLADPSGWRDSAIAGYLTDTPTSTSPKTKDGEYAMHLGRDSQDGRGMGDVEGLGISVSSGQLIDGGEGGEDAHLLEPSQYSHVLKLRRESENLPRSSSVALNAITARYNANELPAQPKPWDRSKAMSVPQSRVISSDGSLAEMLASTSPDFVHHYNLADIPGLEGLNTPSAGGILSSRGFDSPAQLPPGDRSRFLHEGQPFDGRHARPASVGASGMDLHEQYDRAVGTMSTSYDSPASETGTGRTQILDFAETSINAGSSSNIRYRRPSARPEIKEINGIIWGDTNPTATAAASADLAGDAGLRHMGECADALSPSGNSGNGGRGGGSSGSGSRGTADGQAEANATESPTTLNNPEDPSAAGASIPQLCRSDSQPKSADTSALVQEAVRRKASTTSKGKQAGAAHGAAGVEEQALHDPEELAKLVQTSPDPRSLIYDAGSQFGSMSSRKSPAADPAEQRPSISSVFDQDAPPAPQNNLDSEGETAEDTIPEERVSEMHAGSDILVLTPAVAADPAEAAASDVESPDSQMPKARSVSRRGGKVGDFEATPNNATLSGLGFHYDVQQEDGVAESDAVARASIQATHSGESPAIMERKLANDGPAVISVSTTVIATATAAAAAAAAGSAGGASRGKQTNRRVSLQEYVEQQKPTARSRSTSMGHEQLNFRVSLLARKPSGRTKTRRHVSYPSPQSAPPAFAASLLLPPVLGPHEAGGAGVHDHSRQQTASFYETPVLAQRALFSQLLGDGAALTPPDLKDARRQSGGVPLIQPAPPLFDPDNDTGENGVPESVLRAYLAGDLTAIERFFEHVMRITAPSTIYDGEASEDGDWTFGLEGPPPEVLAQREAEKKEQQQRAEGTELQGSTDMKAASHEAPQNAAAGSSSVATAGVVSEDVAPTARAKKAGSVEAAPEESAKSIEVQPSTERVASPSHNSEQSNGSSSRHARKIAIPRSRRAHAKSSSLGSGQPTVAQQQKMPELLETTVDTVDSVLATGALTARGVSASAAAADGIHSHGSSLGVLKASGADCLSPARGRDRNRRLSEVPHRKPIPSKAKKDKKREKQELMARLRVLEGMIQKAAIEESRLQPAPALLKSQLVEGVDSMASIYSSSLDFGYNGSYYGLASNQRQRSHRRRTDSEILSRSSLVSRSQYSRPSYESPARHRRSSNSRRISDGLIQRRTSQQPPILDKLRRGSQERSTAPFRASMLNRAFSSAEYSNDGAAASVNEHRARSKVPTNGTLNTIESNEAAEIAYSARSAGSIKIELIDENISTASPLSDLASTHRIIPFTESSRFRRAARLLGSS
ncbi:hypothetical protein GQ54DRAFT_115443 [Martensiomyces pterosporus]|nr:hypothetical protein GQ54DRAFT_115443 [Martensiomyces pterosporus]